jgi:hypothetical protein
MCIAVALSVCATVALAKSKGKSVNGTITALDSKALAVSVSNKTGTDKTGTTVKNFTVADTTSVVITKTDGTTKTSTVKDGGLNDEVVKAGATVKVTTDETDAVTEVAVGGNYKKAHKKSP